VTRPKTLPLALAVVAVLAAVSLSGCQKSVSQADAASLSASFCGTWLPSVYPVIGAFNAQIRADYKTAAAGCLAVNEGQSVNAVTVALAALALYEGVSATYPKLTAMSDHDLVTAHRLIDGADLGAR